MAFSTPIVTKHTMSVNLFTEFYPSVTKNFICAAKQTRVSTAAFSTKGMVGERKYLVI